MRWWTNEVPWVSDADGLRWYFSEPDPGGLSQLECYRRLLAQSELTKRRLDRAPNYFREFRSLIPYLPCLRP